MNPKAILFFCMIFLAILIASCQTRAATPAPPSPTSVPSATQTATPSPSLTFTPSPSSTPTQTATATITPTPTASPTSTPPGERITLDNLDQVQALETWEFESSYAFIAPYIAWAPDSMRFSVLTPFKLREYQVGAHSASDVMEFPERVAGLSYTPNGQSLLTAADGMLIEYSNQIKQRFHAFPCDASGSLTISPNGQYITTYTATRLFIGGNMYLFLWHYPDFTCEGLLFEGFTYSFNNMVFSPDSQYFAADAGLNVKIWDMPTKEIVCEIDGYGAILSFAPDGTLGVGGGEDFSIWDPSTCQMIQKQSYLFSKSEAIYAMQWSPDGSMLAFANHAGKNLVRIHFWDVASEEIKMTWELDSNTVDQLIFSPNGHYFLTSSVEEYGGAPAQVTLWGIK